MAKPNSELLREKIVAAALSCFQRFGHQRTSMTDIADEAGISRQTIYRMFNDRSMLIRYIIDRRLIEISTLFRERLKQYANFEEALVEGSLEAAKLARQDSVFSDIILNSLDRSVELYLLVESSNIHDLTADLWNGNIEKARDLGLLRNNVTNSQIVEWLRHIQILLLLRDDKNDIEQRLILRQFLVPSIIKDR